MRPLTFALLVVSSVALAAAPPPSGGKTDAKKSGGKKAAPPKFTMPSFGELPKADGVNARPKEQVGQTTAESPLDAKYEVLKVVHAKNFSRTPAGANPVVPLEHVLLRGDPKATEKFASAVRIKCDKKVNAPIEVAILDPRGTTVMTAEGEVSFAQAKNGESDWTVDWEPTSLRPGKHELLVRIAGQPMGTWPVMVKDLPEVK